MPSWWPLALTLSLSALLFSFTLGRYYGYYYDNKFFNLLALELWESPRLYLYLGSHYHVPSSLFSYLLYPLYLVLGPGDFATELLGAIFHLLTIILCYMLGARFHGRIFGALFALFTAFAPIHLVQVYTLPDLSFAIFLSVLAIYLFLTGFEGGSRARLLASAAVFSLAAFQAIYYLLLLPFYLFYSAGILLGGDKGPGSTAGGKKGRLKAGLAPAALLLLSLPAFAYLWLLMNASFGVENVRVSGLLALSFIGALCYLRRPAIGRIALFSIFPLAFFALLAYYDMIVQIDCLFLEKAYGYYLDAAPAGGYGGRPVARLMGKEIGIMGYPVHMSVLTSIFEFAGKDFAKASFISLEALGRLYRDYFVISYTWLTRALFFAGVVALVIRTVLIIRSCKRLPLLHIYPLVWLLSAAAPYLNLGPSYFNIRRIYILPLPLFFSAYGVLAIAEFLGFVAGRFVKRLPRGAVTWAVAVMLAITVSADQVSFAVTNIYSRYLEDKKGYMYFKLFYGHFYGRSYREAGDFILRDAPPRKDGSVSAALVYTIPEDSKVGRSLPLFNTINWYTRNSVQVIFDFKPRSRELYGTMETLAGYLERLFGEYPGIEVIYFADFADHTENFSFFSKAHPDLKPYAVVDDDGSPMYDCVLYRFERGSWREVLDQSGRYTIRPAGI